MLISISKTDVLQSLGFAITAAEEDYERVKQHITDTLNSALQMGQVTPADLQADMSSALIDAGKHVDALKLLKRMAEFEDGSVVMLDAASFQLLEPNLPAR